MPVAPCVLWEEAEQGGRAWRGFSGWLEAVSTLCSCMDPHGSAFPPCQCMTPLLVPAPHVATCSPCLRVHPHAGACPSVLEWRAVHLYWGRGKTAASVMQNCGSLLYFQTSRLRLSVFLVCSTRPSSSSPAEQQPVPWMASPPRASSRTSCCSSSLCRCWALPWEQLCPASKCVPCKPVAMCRPCE